MKKEGNGKGIICIVENFTRRKISKKSVAGIIQETVQSMHGRTRTGRIPFHIYIQIVGMGRSAQLNKEFRGIKKATDVLSFPLEVDQHWADEHAIDVTLPYRAGEIVVCPQIIEQHAKALHRPFRDEWAHVLVHGTLHVLGHHHEKSAKRERELQREENTICKKLGYSMPHPGA